LELFPDKAQWGRLIGNAMAADFTWQRSAREYEQVYRRALLKIGKL